MRDRGRRVATQRKVLGLLLAGLAGAAGPAMAQQITWEGSVRPRLEARDVEVRFGYGY